MKLEEIKTKEQRDELVAKLKKNRNWGVIAIFLGICLSVNGSYEIVTSRHELAFMAGTFYLAGGVLFVIFSIYQIVNSTDKLNEIRRRFGSDAYFNLPTQKPVQPSNSIIFCTACGARNLATSKFCSACGAQLSSTPPPPPVYDFRHIKDVNNVIPYSTLDDQSNHIFYSYIHQAFSDCKIETKVEASTVFPDAPDYAMPINFLITKGEKRVAVLLVHNSRFYRYSLLETKELCKENNVTSLSFYLHLPNEQSYVVDRIRQNIE